LWVAEDGMKMQGYNGSQLWDTAFAVQAIASTGFASEFSRCLRKAHEYIEQSQVVEEAQQPLAEYYRHISKGAWPFSTRDHGWPISDCSSEGLKAALTLARMDASAVGPAIPAERLHDCVNVILSYQNRDGGWATYEIKRSFELLEVRRRAEHDRRATPRCVAGCAVTAPRWRPASPPAPDHPFLAQLWWESRSLRHFSVTVLPTLPHSPSRSSTPARRLARLWWTTTTWSAPQPASPHSQRSPKPSRSTGRRRLRRRCARASST
jgi:hypothetical protein